MEKYKYLFKNIGLLTISNFGSKILVFFLVPLYTRVLSTAEYGSYDIVITTINLLLPILTLSISESVMRFTLDKNNDPKETFTIGLKIVIRAWLFLILLIILNNKFNIISILKTYSLYMLLLFFVNSLYRLCSQFARGTEKIVDLSIAGVISSFAMVIFNVLFLLYFKLGIAGFFLANILSYLMAIIYYIFRLKIYSQIVITKTSTKMIKDMKDYSKPLTLNSISWWINNAADRYIVTWMCGLAVNGVYAIAYKIPSILEVFQSIFLQAWQISAVKSFEDNDKEIFFSQIYNIYNFFMVMLCSVLIIMVKFVAGILFANEFYWAWVFVPVILLANVFGAMSGLIGGVFSAVKDTKIYSYSTTIGAITNIVLNIILIYLIGAMGAAIATATSYFVVWVIRLINSKKYIAIKINLKRDLFVYFILVLQAVFMINISSIKVYIIELIMFTFIGFLYYKEIKGLFKKIKQYVFIK
ncbi:lipopolysaccharide biosynthesis protein [Syntrophomonas erecta]